METIRYGPSSDHEADLHLPAAARPPVVCLLHGGFWRMPYGRDQMTPLAAALASCGFAVWNLEYRRLGAPEGGWPATLDDVATGVNHLAEVRAGGVDLDLDRVTVVGHSAGGHLALWVAARRQAGRAEPAAIPIRAAVGLAPVADLVRASERGLGGNAAAELMGGSPSQQPERYRAASPAEMLPLGVRQLILHGTADDTVAIDLSRDYARAAAAAGDAIELVELPDTGHMELLDPRSAAHATLRGWLQATAAIR
jgi:acetyl esterase/lipase